MANGVSVTPIPCFVVYGRHLDILDVVFREVAPTIGEAVVASYLVAKGDGSILSWTKAIRVPKWIWESMVAHGIDPTQVENVALLEHGSPVPHWLHSKEFGRVVTLIDTGSHWIYVGVW